MGGGDGKSAASVGYKDLILGGGIQCVEAATLGMPFEVWKTYMGRHRDLSTIQSFRAIYAEGGVFAFWKGLSPKLVESASKGAILLYAKEAIRVAAIPALGDGGLNGAISGAGAGVIQVRQVAGSMNVDITRHCLF